MESCLEDSWINHKDIILAIAFSSNGYFATAGLDATARVWEVTSGLLVACVNHEDIILAIAFSFDGSYFATASEDCTVQVWESNSGRRVACLAHEESVKNVVFSPDGEHLVTVGGSKLFPQSKYTTCTVTLWEVRTGRRVIYINHDYDVNAVAFSHDGKDLAIASADCTVWVWEAIISQKFVDLTHKVNVTAFNRGNLTIMCDYDWTRKASTKPAVARMTYDYSIVAVTFSPSAQYLATANLNGTVQVWEVISGREIARMTHEQEIKAIAFSPNEKHLAIASNDFTARVWEITRNQAIAHVTLEDNVNAVAFSSDGRLLATASGDLMLGGQDYIARLWFWQPT